MFRRQLFRFGRAFRVNRLVCGQIKSFHGTPMINCHKTNKFNSQFEYRIPNTNNIIVVQTRYNHMKKEPNDDEKQFSCPETKQYPKSTPSEGFKPATVVALLLVCIVCTVACTLGVIIALLKYLSNNLDALYN